MWLVSCSRQGTLTQGPVPDSKCKLNISLFLTFLHPLDCRICAKNIMNHCDFCASDGGMVKIGDGSFMLGFRLEDREWVSYLF